MEGASGATVDPVSDLLDCVIRLMKIVALQVLEPFLDVSKEACLSLLSIGEGKDRPIIENLGSIHIGGGAL
jgi:hypothetical protein